MKGISDFITVIILAALAGCSSGRYCAHTDAQLVYHLPHRVENYFAKSIKKENRTYNRTNPNIVFDLNAKFSRNGLEKWYDYTDNRTFSTKYTLTIHYDDRKEYTIYDRYICIKGKLHPVYFDFTDNAMEESHCKRVNRRNYGRDFFNNYFPYAWDKIIVDMKNNRFYSDYNHTRRGKKNRVYSDGKKERSLKIK